MHAVDNAAEQPVQSRVPPVSVVLPVYNGQPHLPQAVDSILRQSHGDFELIVVDDGSTDGTGEYLDGLADPRVRVIHQPNSGLVASLNTAIAEAKHELIARMDADDVSQPDRLLLQAGALSGGATAVVACCYRLINDFGTHIGDVHVPADADYLARQLYFRNVLPHGGVMFRKSAVEGVGGYRAVGPAEDYDLWTRLLPSHRISSLPDQLFTYRVTSSGVSQTALDEQRRVTRGVRTRLQAEWPLVVPSAAQIARAGTRLVHEQGKCRDIGASYVFDHVGLAVQQLRRSNWRNALRLLVGAVLVAARHPRTATSLVRLWRTPEAHVASVPPSF